MKQKISEQLGFADAWLGNNQQLNQQREKINRMVNWQPFEDLLLKVYSSPTERPRHPVLLLFKALLLQTWHSLSDYFLE